MEHSPGHDSHHENEELDKELLHKDYTYARLSEDDKKKKRKHLKEHKTHHAEKQTQKQKEKARSLKLKNMENKFVWWMFGKGFNFGFKFSKTIVDGFEHGKLERPAPLGGVGENDSPIDVYQTKAHNLAHKLGLE